MQKTKTHFEQVPVEAVKQIAQELHPSAAELPAPANTDRQALESPKERWREVAQQVQMEQDPNKMIQLVDQLIATFDEENSRASKSGRSNGPLAPQA